MEPHPSALLFVAPAWTVAVARVYPQLLLWMVRESRRNYQRNMVWVQLRTLALWAYVNEPASWIVHVD